MAPHIMPHCDKYICKKKKKSSHTLLLLSILLLENSLIQIDLHFDSESEDESKIVNWRIFEAFISKWHFAT